MNNTGVDIGVDWYFLQIWLDVGVIVVVQLQEEGRLELTGLLLMSILANLVTAYDYLNKTNYLYDTYPLAMHILYSWTVWTTLTYLVFVLVLIKGKKRENKHNGIK